MMNFYRFKKTLFELSINHKLIFGGTLLTMLGTIFPWYEDQDPYGGSQLYYGVSGPLYLVGVFILIMSLIVLSTFVFEKFYNKSVHLPISHNVLWFVFGIQSFVLMLIALSAFYHPKFGFNLYLKETKFGLFLSFLGIIFVTAGAYRETRQSNAVSTETKNPEEAMQVQPIRRHGTARLSKKQQQVEDTNLTLDL